MRTIPIELKLAINNDLKKVEATLIASVLKLREVLQRPVKKLHHYIVPVTSLHEFIECVEFMQLDLQWNSPIIFRGHSDCGWKLMPSLMRETMFSAAPDSPEVNMLEEDLLSKFRKHALPLIAHVPTGKGKALEWTALAQHHNLPTRLLDWTYSAGTALFFAVEQGSKALSKHSCVWAIKSPPEIDFEKDDIRNKEMPIRLFNPPHVSPRITAQQGCFTVHPSYYSKKYFEWIENNRVIFVIAEKHRRNIRHQLHSMGVSVASVYPDLDGVARSLIERAYQNIAIHGQPYDRRHGDE